MGNFADTAKNCEAVGDNNNNVGENITLFVVCGLKHNVHTRQRRADVNCLAKDWENN